MPLCLISYVEKLRPKENKGLTTDHQANCGRPYTGIPSKAPFHCRQLTCPPWGSITHTGPSLGTSTCTV